MTIHINAQRAAELLHIAVEQRGAGYVYEQQPGQGCVYTVGPETAPAPSCAVGTALCEAGVDRHALWALDNGGVELEDFDAGYFYANEPRKLADTSIDSPAVLAWLAENGVDISDEAVALFKSTQRQQDDGVAWGPAVDRALLAIAEDTLLGADAEPYAEPVGVAF